MKIRITAGQVLAFGIAGGLLGVVLVWVFSPTSLPYFENIWNLTGKPGIGVRALAVPVFLFLIFAIGLKRY